MSEFRNNQQEVVGNVLREVNGTLHLPEDGRWDIAAGLLIMGGRDASVLAYGEPGGGKTAFGNAVQGAEHRTDIVPTDTYDTLFGYVRPTDQGFNPGKVKLDDNNPVIHLGEVSHIETGAIHGLWDSAEYFEHPDGRRIPMENASIYATANFPNGGRSKPLDEAFMSRFAMTAIVGDSDNGAGAKIQGVDLAGDLDSTGSERGFLPKADQRKAIRESLMRNSPLSRDIGPFAEEVISRINGSGLFAPVHDTDGRIGRGWQQVARAKRLVEGKADDYSQITPEEYAAVGALGLSTALKLSNAGKSGITEALGRTTPMTELQKVVIARRAAAQILFESAMDFGDFAERDRAKRLSQYVDKRSYVNLSSEQSGLLIDHIDKQLHDSPSSPKIGAKDAKSSRLSLRRRS